MAKLMGCKQYDQILPAVDGKPVGPPRADVRYIAANATSAYGLTARETHVHGEYRA
jgi:hypothetical protein